MKADRSDPHRTPEFLAAAAWLIGCTTKDERNVLRRARLIGLLIKTKTGEDWKYDGFLLGRLIERRVRSGNLPQHGAVLIGIGDIIARAHAPDSTIERQFERLFRRSRPQTFISNRLREALDVARQYVKKPRRKLLPTIYADPTLSLNDWSCLRTAGDWMQYPTPFGDFAGYGLSFVTRLQLKSAPQRLRWFVKEAEARHILSSVVGAVREACFWTEASARNAIRSGIPFFVGFGVARLRDEGEDGKGWIASELDELLAEYRVPLHGRMLVSALMLKEAVHAWHRQKGRPDDNRRRRTLLRLEPKHAVGGEQYAVNEIKRLAAEEASLDARRTAVLSALEDALQSAARHDIDPVKLTIVFEPSLVDTPEIRHRFAMKHTAGPTRNAALQTSLAVFDELIGARRSKTVCRENFDSVRANRELTYWMAASQIELSTASGSDAGRDAARRIAKLEAALRSFTLQPFAASRFNERFQHALHRWSLLLEFALFVALSSPGAPLIQLRDLALQSAKLFLPTANRFSHNIKLTDTVIGLVSDALSSASISQSMSWINDENQPILLRAQLVWSRPQILEVTLPLASSLIENIATQDVFSAEPGRIGSALINIVDRAAAVIYRETRYDLGPLLNVPYSAAATLADGTLVKSLNLDTLLAAISNNPEARMQLFEDPVWSRSRISEALRA